MKKLLAVAVLLVSIAVAFNAGKNHALNDSFVSLEKGEGVEVIVRIDIDGNRYEHVTSF